MRETLITSGSMSARAGLLQNETANAIWEALPIAASGSAWGDEICFSTPAPLAPEDGREAAALGDLGYWPPGDAFCVLFGSTPLSRGAEIRLASAVSVFGRTQGNPKLFEQARSGARLRSEQA